MLTLGMAFCRQPRLLMIDELSLGLAPRIVDELLEAVRELAGAGHDDHPRRAVGERRAHGRRDRVLHGEGRDPLPRPDQRAARAARRPALGVPRRRGVDRARRRRTGDRRAATRRRRVAPTARRRATARDARSALDASTDVSKRFGGIAALTDVSFDVARGRDPRLHRPERRGQDDAVRRDLRLPAGRPRATCSLDGDDDRRRSAPTRRARRGLGRSFQDGRLFPALTVARDDRGRARAQRRRARPDRGRAAPARRSPTPKRRSRTGSRSSSSCSGLGAFRDKFVRELSTGSRRIVDLACVLAHGPSVLLLDEPSSGIAQREAEALGPLLLRIRDMTGASLLVIEHDVPLLTSIADRMIALDLGEVVAIGTPSRGRPTTRAVVASYLGESEAVVARSGPRATSNVLNRGEPMATDREMARNGAARRRCKRYGPFIAGRRDRRGRRPRARRCSGGDDDDDDDTADATTPARRANSDLPLHVPGGARSTARTTTSTGARAATPRPAA